MEKVSHIGMAILGFLALSACGGGVDAPGGSTAAPGVKDSDTAKVLILSTATTSASRVTLTWSGSGGRSHTYRVYRNGELDRTIVSGSDGATDIDLTPGTEYCYQVTAVDGAGANTSNTSCATTPTLAGWNMQTIPTAPPVSLALDPQGRERMSYCSQWSGVIYMARQADGSWNSTAVDPMARCFDALISVGGDGADYLIYMDDDSDELKYATDVSGSWTVTTVPGAEGAEFYAMAIDDADHIHLAYQLFTGVAPDCFEIIYETNASGSWESQKVAVGDVYPAIAVDGAGTAYIAFLGGQDADGSYPVHFLSDASGSWMDSEVAESADPKSLVALAVDRAGHGHLAYKSHDSLRYATDASGSWHTTQVDSFDAGPEVDSYGVYDVSLAVDGFGRPHVSYQDTAGSLKYAADRQGRWEAVYVDTQGIEDQLKIDPAGRVHLIYGSAANAPGLLLTTLAVSP